VTGDIGAGSTDDATPGDDTAAGDVSAAGEGETTGKGATDAAGGDCPFAIPEKTAAPRTILESIFANKRSMVFPP
jgi:hypothetical protein